VNESDVHGCLTLYTVRIV